MNREKIFEEIMCIINTDLSDLSTQNVPAKELAKELKKLVDLSINDFEDSHVPGPTSDNNRFKYLLKIAGSAVLMAEDLIRNNGGEIPEEKLLDDSNEMIDNLMEAKDPRVNYESFSLKGLKVKKVIAFFEDSSENKEMVKEIIDIGGSFTIGKDTYRTGKNYLLFRINNHNPAYDECKFDEIIKPYANIPEVSLLEIRDELRRLNELVFSK